MSNSNYFDVPILDLDGIYSDDKERLDRIAKDLLEIGGKCGVVQVKNHGISLEKIPPYSDLTDQFFSLPLETKIKYQHPTVPFLGYKLEEREFDGQNFEQFEALAITNDGKLSFPEDEIPGFTSQSLEFYGELARLSNRMMLIYDLALDCGDFFRKTHTGLVETAGGFRSFKMLNYPAVPQNIEVGTLRLIEHEDAATHGLLLPSSEGYQIKDKEGSWKYPKLIKGTIIVQFGILMDILSSGRIPSLSHRVVVAECQKLPHGRPRRAFAHFHLPPLGQVIKPLDGSDYHEPITPQGVIEKSKAKYFSLYPAKSY